MSDPIRIFLVDDHSVLRAGLQLLLDAEADMQVIGQSSDAIDALQQVENLRPDLILMDISMPRTTGLEALREMKERAPTSRIIILTMHDDEGYLRLALSSGASGYVLKQAANHELLSAIRAVQQGGTYLHTDHQQLLFGGNSPAAEPAPHTSADQYERLSPREKEILRMLASGYTNRQAAEELFLSEKTVETYKARVMVKLNLHSRTELVRYALSKGIIKA